jgi:2-succinyl-5-enolpyruvyl-6-hydroxy-3-cyclohexene-1-carboxylate synthase
MTRLRPIYDIAELCARKGLKHAILSPGSRCAPLTLAFTRHEKIHTKTISDERSAGFIGLGIARQTHSPVILMCTSGTAGYNFTPAVAEAFFSNTPLIVFTADRPAEWIAQQDGQTIHQENIFGRHVKKSFQLPQEYDHPDSQWFINRSINEAINLATQYPQGPVHINVPLREPLYPDHNEPIGFSEEIRVIESIPPPFSMSVETKEQLQKEWSQFNRILIVVGQQEYDDSLLLLVEQVLKKFNLPVVGDILSNVHQLESLIKHGDLFLGQAPAEIKKSLQPDLLITLGGQVISKNLKLFLREYPPTAHWHVQPAGTPPDTFQHLTRIVYTDPIHFFEFLYSLQPARSFESQKQNNYQKMWGAEEHKAERTLNGFFPQPQLGELELVKLILQQLPDRCNLHLANSMSVRYANFIGLGPEQKHVRVFANRGTSGIDGCTSAAVGHSLVSVVPNILITGDMAFFYDRNAFWNNYPVPDFRVVVLNNHGGIIFRMIDGPASLPESNEYFVTHQKLTAKKMCEEFGFDYLKIDNPRKIKNTLKDFFAFEGTTKVLELESTIDHNTTTFENLKQKIKNNYEA